MLLGITRRTVFDICAELDIPYQEGGLTADLIQRADEIFLTSTAGGVMPVTGLDGKPVGSGDPGPLSRTIHRTYWEWRADPRWIDPVDYTHTR